MPWEAGSEFHWMGIRQGSLATPWPQRSCMFSRGRDIPVALWRLLSGHSSAKPVHIPEYFCQDVVAHWRKCGLPIVLYRDNPALPFPDTSTLNPSSGDFVVAVNYFGIRDGAFWSQWKKDNDSIVLIEDHTHDPCSPWALASEADYVFSSLRKTFPVTDGAILWSPQGLTLPEEPKGPPSTGSALKLAAMIVKNDYLDNGDESLKGIYRQMQIEGENAIEADIDCAIAPWSRILVEGGCPEAWRKQRESNVMALFELIEDCNFGPLFSQWPRGGCPYNAILVYPTYKEREEARLKCLERDVYVSIHWDISKEVSAESHDLSRRILTVPVDQRYGPEDVRRIAEILASI